ncbi:hypothetical protein IIA94_02330 [Patescibacteria group bacterium]|nr:hypothetical protein [Patescibacteria group bacterium]
MKNEQNKKNPAEISSLDSINIYEITKKSVLLSTKDAEKIGVAILSRAIKAQPKGIGLFVIDFGKIDAMDKSVAVAICAALNGIVWTAWEQFFVFQNLRGGAKRALEIEMVESGLVSVLLEVRSPQLFGDKDTVKGGVKIWEYLLKQGQWKEVREVAKALGLTEVYARAHLTRLYENGLAFRDTQPRYHLYRVVGLKKDLKH